MKTVALYNVKGGVGKTAAAVNLAHLAAQAGHETLLWDLDSQGAASWYLHGPDAAQASAKKVVDGDTPLADLVQPTPHDKLSLIPADLSYRALDTLLRKIEPREGLKLLLKPLAKRFDLVVLDCPPSISHLADHIFRAADLILVPVVPTHLSLRALKQLQDYFAAQKLDAGKLAPFWSMADRRRLLHRLMLERPPNLMRGGFGVFIPYASAVERMGEHRAPVSVFAASEPAGEAYVALWKKLRKALEL
jgi:chromosome partitioning protein